jgi:hypothetical protein
MRLWSTVTTLAIVVSVGATACGGGGARPSSTSASQADRARAAEHLQGRWVLVEFRPEQPLEPMLAGLLAAQLGKLAITFQGNVADIQGVGIAARRSFEVTEAAGDGAKIVLRDPDGTSYDVLGSFQGNAVAFTALTAPWRGTGRLIRAQ